jgi:hypothetical protein
VIFIIAFPLFTPRLVCLAPSLNGLEVCYELPGPEDDHIPAPGLIAAGSGKSPAAKLLLAEISRIRRFFRDGDSAETIYPLLPSFVVVATPVLGKGETSTGKRTPFE